MVAAGMTGTTGRALLLLATLSAVVTAACGGGGGNSPTSPTAPTAPTTPSASACDTLGLTASAAILNGSECPTGNTAVVLLNMRDRSGFAIGACSGTVIGERAILTAAHCVDEDVQLVRMFLGSGLEVVAASFTAHQDYRGGVTNDVAIVLMNEPIGRRPIPLLLSRDARVGESAAIAGWGLDLSNVPATFRAGLTTLTSAGNVLQTQFGATVSSICQGDSGGPILVSEGGAWAVAGVSSATSQNVCNTGTNFYVALRNPVVSSFLLSLVPDAAQR